MTAQEFPGVDYNMHVDRLYDTGELFQEVIMEPTILVTHLLCAQRATSQVTFSPSSSTLRVQEMDGMRFDEHIGCGDDNLDLPDISSLLIAQMRGMPIRSDMYRLLQKAVA